jgi:uncharacterized protein (DUF433 family)
MDGNSLDLCPKQFVFTYPVWFCRHKDDLDRGVMGGTLEGGHKFVALFTDDHMAELYIGERGAVGEARPEPLVSPSHLAMALHAFREAGSTHAVFDNPGKGEIARRAISIDELLEKLPMVLMIHRDDVPLRVDEYGDVRVGTCRVLLDTVIRAYQRGEGPEAIAAGYDPLALPDVYNVIGYYLRHREEVDAYLAQRERDAERLEAEILAARPRGDLRAELEARRAKMEQGNDSAPE